MGTWEVGLGNGTGDSGAGAKVAKKESREGWEPSRGWKERRKGREEK